MKPIDPNIDGLEAVIYAKDQPEYKQLPARRDENGVAVTCWTVGWRERIKVLFGCNLYITVLTFNNPIQPMRVELTPPEVQ